MKTKEENMFYQSRQALTDWRRSARNGEVAFFDNNTTAYGACDQLVTSARCIGEDER